MQAPQLWYRLDFGSGLRPFWFCYSIEPVNPRSLGPDLQEKTDIETVAVLMCFFLSAIISESLFCFLQGESGTTDTCTYLNRYRNLPVVPTTNSKERIRRQ